MHPRSTPVTFPHFIQKGASVADCDNPALLITQNGSGVSATTTQKFDLVGSPTESTDERGLTNKSIYDVVTKAMMLSIVVFGTGKQNLTTNFGIDAEGRTTQTKTLRFIQEAVIGTTAKQVWTHRCILRAG